MKLLIVTQKVNEDDPILGFFHRWIIELAKHFEFVTVICLEEGRHELPVNVKVLSLGKEKGASRLSQMARFYSHIFNERKNYDAVFVHMNPIYVVLAGWFWKLSNKKVALWYTHKAVDMKLRIAERFSDVIFTAAKESFTLKTKKLMVVGHGINVAMYANELRTKIIGSEPIAIVGVGRITPIKNCDTLVETARILKERWVLKGGGGKRFTVTFIGSPITEGDKEYSEKVKGLVEKYDLGEIVSFIGDVNPSDMPAKYAAADVTVNLTPTGGLDKVVLESMAAGVPAFTSNEAFIDYLEPYADKLIFKERNANDLAGKVVGLFDRIGTSDDPKAIGGYLRSVVLNKADVTMLIGVISGKLTSWKDR